MCTCLRVSAEPSLSCCPFIIDAAPATSIFANYPSLLKHERTQTERAQKQDISPAEKEGLLLTSKFGTLCFCEHFHFPLTFLLIFCSFLLSLIPLPFHLIFFMFPVLCSLSSPLPLHITPSTPFCLGLPSSLFFFPTQCSYLIFINNEYPIYSRLCQKYTEYLCQHITKNDRGRALEVYELLYLFLFQIHEVK